MCFLAAIFLSHHPTLDNSNISAHVDMGYTMICLTKNYGTCTVHLFAPISIHLHPVEVTPGSSSEISHGNPEKGLAKAGALNMFQ
jgi:hypothetical protein